MSLRLKVCGAALGSFLLGLCQVHAQADSHRGLWIGQATLNFVNEVTVPFDEDNVAIAPDPNVPTPTRDQAHLRLILHVNGAGQVSLLKDVAILDRAAGGVTGDGTRLIDLIENPSALDFTNPALRFESDVALVTDERLYGDFPVQPAVRIASAAFDFGDSKATEAVDAVLESVVDAVAASVQAKSRSDVSTNPGRRMAEEDAVAAAETAAAPVIAAADVVEAFHAFMRNDLTLADVDAIAAAPTPATATETTDAQTAATALRNASFFGDPRGEEMVAAVLAAIAGATPGEEVMDAQNAAAAFADVADQYHRFLASKLFGDFIGPAVTAAVDDFLARNRSTDPIPLRQTIDAVPETAAVQAEALRIQATEYRDTRATIAVSVVKEAIVDKLVASSPADDRDTLIADADAAARLALDSSVARYEVPLVVPTTDYDEFIASEAFQESASVASAAAAEAAVLDRNANLFSDLTSLKNEGKAAALVALRSTYNLAALAVMTELPLTGAFGAGGSATGTINLPANHPTNPFRHRRHPDHTTGFDITRVITLEFAGSPPDPLARAGYSVHQIEGFYQEEIHGLHKPLGQNQDIGLKVAGSFVLSRISLIDNLNAR